MKTTITAIAATIFLAACGQAYAPDDDAASAEPEALYEPDQVAIMNKTAIPVGAYKSPPEPHYGPRSGSISFTDTDPGPTIGGTLTMQPAVEADARITMYMIHWGLEVGEPGTEDDSGNGDMGGNCMGFRDTGHVVMMPAADAGETMSWNLPAGTAVPEGAVYFVGHALYGDIHNLAKCTQTVIANVQG
ncbi:MAG: hypothetical protein L3J02_04950 [Henriciella sp.]|nr:hypothetical protein [Henriciella sp.]